MKISPATSASIPSVNPNEGHSAGADRMARAKAAMTGQVVETQSAPQAAQPNDLKRITMRTQRSTNRYEPPTEPTSQEVPKTDTLANNEPAKPDPQASSPDSPQYAALAKAKRALQAKEREIAAREAAIKSSQQENHATGYTKDQIKANALRVLREAGVTNDELTDQILRETSDYGPAYSKLESEINAVKQSLENQTKTLSEQEAATEKQVLTQVRKDVDALIAEGDEYEAVRTAGYAPKVVELIYKVFKAEGEILSADEAATLIENELINDSLKFARLKKIQSRLQPEPQPQAAKLSAPNTKIMRTLTNRDGASLPASPRERAIAAFYGKLK